MPRWPKLHAMRWALGFSLLVGLTLCALPLVGTLGPESALALGLLLSPCCAAWSARLTVRARTQPRRTGALLAEAISDGWLLLALPVGLLALNALRVKTCDPWSGLAFIALGAWGSVTIASLTGVAIGSLVRGPRLAQWLAGLFPLCTLGRAAFDFVETPGIFAFGHYFGYFPGTFYDRRIEVPDAWLSHRVLSALLYLALWAFLSAARSPRNGLLSLQRASRHPALSAWVILLASVGVLMARASDELGHTTSSRFVAHKLGLVVQGKRCHAVVPRELDVNTAARLTDDCEFRIAQLERLLGVKERSTITAFFFRSAQEKRNLMGAMRVYIAKPWRREVYLQLADYPHPVLPHELAHVVARNAASGMFGVPGKLDGLIPEPTLVEGTAVALEPLARDELTPHQWAKAAQEAKLAPRLSALLGPGFFGQNQQLAYTLAGSFLRFVLDTKGAEALRKLYREGSAERALGKPFSELEREWQQYLATIPLPPPAAALAKQRFERASVFSQVCPHAIERIEGELSAALSSGDMTRAHRKCEEILAIDPQNTSTRATWVGVLAREGKPQAAEDQLEKLRKPPEAPRPTLARAQVALADAAFLNGDFERAESTYRKLLLEPQGESELRQLEVKLLALEAGDPARGLIRELLIGRPGHTTDPRAAMHLIDELNAYRRDGLALYLAARQLIGADRPDLALPLIRSARARGLPTRRLQLEAVRMHALCAFQSGLLDETETCYRELAQVENASLAERAEAQDGLMRVAYRRTGKLPR